ncbi:MAG: hypothetical protein JXA30_15015 [Deltaproteobacteria bacterium]|nr:hypothetical protein [Deltaproteobacteria bacterium]
MVNATEINVISGSLDCGDSAAVTNAESSALCGEGPCFDLGTITCCAKQGAF